MRLDGYSPFNTLPGRSVRALPGAEVARVDQPAERRVEVTREVEAARSSTAVAEYIPARRDTPDPIHGKVGQALASYTTTARMTAQNEVEGVFGIDLYA